MSRLQRAPYGWLGALDLKAEGQNPNAVADSIFGHLRAEPFYYTPLVTKQASSQEAAVIDGTLLSLGPSDGEAWLVHSVSCAVGLHATDIVLDDMAVNIGFRESSQAPGSAFYVSPYLRARTVVADMTFRGATLLDWMLVPSGGELTFSTTGSVTLSANASLVLAALVYAFKT